MKGKKHCSEAEQAEKAENIENSETAAQEASEEKTADLEQTLLEKEAQIKELREEAARATADYYNLRMRVERDRQKDMKYAAERAVTELLPVYENLERVTASISDKEDSLAKGISMVEQQFMEVLKNLGLEVIPAEGKFDPSLHEAVMLEPVEEEEKDGEIIAVFRKGYTLAGRVLRAAQVKVGKKEE